MPYVGLAQDWYATAGRTVGILTDWQAPLASRRDTMRPGSHNRRQRHWERAILTRKSYAVIEYNIEKNNLSPHILLFIPGKPFICQYGIPCFSTERGNEEHETKICNAMPHGSSYTVVRASMRHCAGDRHAVSFVANSWTSGSLSML